MEKQMPKMSNSSTVTIVLWKKMEINSTAHNRMPGEGKMKEVKLGKKGDITAFPLYFLLLICLYSAAE